MINQINRSIEAFLRYVKAGLSRVHDDRYPLLRGDRVASRPRQSGSLSVPTYEGLLVGLSVPGARWVEDPSVQVDQSAEDLWVEGLGADQSAAGDRWLEARWVEGLWADQSAAGDRWLAAL